VIIQSEALNKSFSRHDALRGISLAVPEGSIYATVFLSSHELDEIEGSTTYVGYLENGRLLFQESMAELSDRVREVRVTLGHDAQIPQGSPGTWISFSGTLQDAPSIEGSTSDGTLYVIDYDGIGGADGGPVVRKITPDGVESKFAGPNDREGGAEFFVP